MQAHRPSEWPLFTPSITPALTLTLRSRSRTHRRGRSAAVGTDQPAETASPFSIAATNSAKRGTCVMVHISERWD